MRHNKSGRKFSLDPDVRKAMLRNMSDSLIANGRITQDVKLFHGSGPKRLLQGCLVSMQKPSRQGTAVTHVSPSAV